MMVRKVTMESVMPMVLPDTTMAYLRTAMVLPKMPMAFLKTIIAHLRKAMDHLMTPTLTAMDILRISITTVLVDHVTMCTSLPHKLLSLFPMATEHL